MLKKIVNQKSNLDKKIFKQKNEKEDWKPKKITEE